MQLIVLSSCQRSDNTHKNSRYQNNVLSVRATEMLYNGLSHTSSLCIHSSRGSYCDSQPCRRSRRRTSSGFPSPQACSEVPAGNRASRPTEEEVTEGRLLASSPLAMFSSHFVMLFWRSRGIWRDQRQVGRAFKKTTRPVVTFKIK